MREEPSSPPWSLDLSAAPSVVYLYGLAGAGKNFVGDLIGKLSGRFVYHADQDLTDEMRCAAREGRIFTPEMRDTFFRVVADRIIDLQRIHGPLVATQATYKTQHRDYLQSRIRDIDLICITASDAKIVERLTKRGDFVTADYAAKMRGLFDPPAAASRIIENEIGTAEILQQVRSFYELPAVHAIQSQLSVA